MKIRQCASVTFWVLAASVVPAQDPCGEWSVFSTPDPGDTTHAVIQDITFIAPDDVWAVGDFQSVINGVYASLALSMHWDGQGWSRIDTPQPSPCPTCTYVSMLAVDGTGPNDVWAVGHQRIQAPDGFTGTHILVMHWDGAQWQVMQTPVQAGASGDILSAVVAIAPDDVWFFGENLYSGSPLLLDLAIAMHWDGSGFEFVPMPIVNFQSSGFGDGNSIRAASALASDDIWAVGAGGDGDSLSCNLSQIHHWDGQSWTHIPAQAPDGCFWHSLDAVFALAPDDVWVGGEKFDGGYAGLALHWDGATWTEHPIPIGVTDFHAFAGDDVYAVGGGVAHWDGHSWTVVETFPTVFGAALFGVDAYGPCGLWAGGRRLTDDGMLTFASRLDPSAPTADVDGDGDVDISDLALLLGTFGLCSADAAYNANADFDGSGCIELGDLAVLLANFGG